MRNYEIVGYESKLSIKDTQRAIKVVKDGFQTRFAKALNLDRVTAPLMVEHGSGINDDLNGVERKVEFTIKNADKTVEIVQSLAKWKRMQLHRFGYKREAGIYTDMNAIRRDDDMDNTHSIFVDQWDWEMVIEKEDRTLEYLQSVVRKIVKVMSEVQKEVSEKYPQIQNKIEEEVFFITTQELEDRYPELTGQEREDAITKEYKTVFLMQIGDKLKSGEPHDGRAPDYDDWTLNGDILIWDKTLNSALEVSSMGIRVDSDSLKRQLAARNAEDRMQYEYHKNIANNVYPLTIGGGIGQSRICMLLLEKAHIGEVQCSIWPDHMRENQQEKGIILL